MKRSHELIGFIDGSYQIIMGCITTVLYKLNQRKKIKGLFSNLFQNPSIGLMPKLGKYILIHLEKSGRCIRTDKLLMWWDEKSTYRNQ